MERDGREGSVRVRSAWVWAIGEVMCGERGDGWKEVRGDCTEERGR